MLNNEMIDKLADRISEIMNSEKEVQQKIMAAVSEGIENSQAGLEHLPGIIEKALTAVTDSAKNLLPEERQQRLQSAYTGVEQALITTITSLRLSLEEAAGEGKKFAKEDMSQTREELETLGEMLKETLGNFFSKSESLIEGQGESFKDHTVRLAETLSPSLTATLKAVSQYPSDLLSEKAASAGEFVAKALSSAADRLSKK